MIDPRPAATVVIARDGNAGMEVLLLQRTHSAVFMPGVYVFPGGAVDDADYDPLLWRSASELDDPAASRMLGLDRGGLAYLMAAVREAFEEAGLLLADPPDGGPLAAHPGLDLPALRQRLCAGELDMVTLCREYGLRLHTHLMGHLAHWVTPPGPPRRYDTRFLVAPAPEGQQAGHDGRETIDHVWITPAEALRRNREGAFPLGPPTIRTLRTLVGFDDVAAALAHGRSGPRPVHRPVTAGGRDGPRPIEPGEPAYAEAAKLAAERVDSPAYELLPGVTTHLSRRIRRIVAPNPGVMTGPGTNTYLVGAGDDLAVIDPGPEIASHIEAIAATGGRIRWILTTHTHRDHSPASRALSARTGATVIGMPAPPAESHDTDFAPTQVPAGGDRLAIDPETTLRVIHTPGHASNHLCYFLEEEGILFSGDHIMQGSTVVISPPDGHMGQYLASLERLHHEDIRYIAPGHGFLMDEAHRVIDRIVSHRLARESKVVECLSRLAGAAEAQLLDCVYDDVPRAMHPVARRSLQAHLIKLRDEGRAVEQAEGWALRR